MYSVVLMAALTTGAASPAWGCHGCHGCYSSCHGCWSSCHGCWGSCSGCWGGCWGSCSGCHGCWGGGWRGCHGCNGCWGGCYGSWSCSGCYGGCYGGYASGCYCYGGYGCNGCNGCYGGPAYPPAMGVPAGPGTGTPPPAKPAEPIAPPKPGSTQLDSAPAKVTVTLPADASLFVDDQLMKTTSANRVFRTPELDPSATYYYILRAEVVRDGQKQTKTKQILVRAGQDVQTSFPELEPVSTASAQAALKR